jgi:hypothetical protein
VGPKKKKKKTGIAKVTGGEECQWEIFSFINL